MDIITGHRGVAHVTSADIQAFNLGIVGGANTEEYGANVYVLRTGSRLAATIVSNTRISIADGVGVCGGVAFRIAQGTTETVPISAGTAGYKRGDFICVHYTRNTSTGVENAELAVIEGTPSPSGTRFPDMPTDSIYEGATDAYYVLYKVYINGTTISSVTRSGTNTDVQALSYMTSLGSQIDTLRDRMAPIPTLVTQMDMVTSALGHMYQAQLAVAGGGTGTIDLDENIMSGSTYTVFLVSAAYNSAGPTYDYVGLLFLNKTAGTTHVLDIAKGNSANVTFSVGSGNILTIANGVNIFCRASVIQIYG